MENYFMEWYDKQMETMTTFRINDKQKNLMEFLLRERSLDTILAEADIIVNITESENQVIDFT